MRIPVIILGAPRSGTTLLRNLLNRHPQLAMCGETAFFDMIYRRLGAFGDLADATNRARAVDAYLSTQRVQQLKIDIALLRERLLRDGATARDFFRTILECYAQTCGKPYTGEKTPRHCGWATTFVEWFPQCAIVHLVRDPRDSCSSLITMPWESRSVLRAARIWRNYNAAALAVADRENYLRISYESLAAESAVTLQRICAHVGLPFAPEMLNVPASGHQNWWHTRAWQGVMPTRIGKWRDSLDPWQASAIEAVDGELMAQLGYEPQAPPAKPWTMARAYLDGIFEVGLQKFSRLPVAFFYLLRPTQLSTEEKWRRRATALYGRLRSPAPPDEERAQTAT